MKITELKKDSVIFLLINLQHTKIMKKEDHNAVPDSLLTKEFLSQFKTEEYLVFVEPFLREPT